MVQIWGELNSLTWKIPWLLELDYWWSDCLKCHQEQEAEHRNSVHCLTKPHEASQQDSYSRFPSWPPWGEITPLRHSFVIPEIDTVLFNVAGWLMRLGGNMSMLFQSGLKIWADTVISSFWVWWVLSSTLSESGDEQKRGNEFICKLEATGRSPPAQASVNGRRRSGGFGPHMGSSSGQRLDEPVNKRAEIQPAELEWRQKWPLGVCLPLSCH